MRALGLCVLILTGCSSNKIVEPEDSGSDAGKPDAGADAAKDSGGMDAGTDGGKLDGYYAWGKSGAPNRIFIYYADAQADLCFVLRVESGTNMTAVTIPTGWDLKTVGTGVFRSAAACTPFYTGNAEFMQNLSSSGSLNWSGMTVPGTIWTLDVMLNFAPSWAPSSQALQAMNLNVQMF